MEQKFYIKIIWNKYCLFRSDVLVFDSRRALGPSEVMSAG